MSITQALCNSYKKEILEGLHHSDHEYKIALFTNLATLNKSTTSYTGQTEEVVGDGYTIGGKILIGYTTTIISDTAILDFTTNPEWTAASFTTRGALIYNNSLAGKNAVAVLDFGADFTVTIGVFTVTIPSPAESTALIRIV